MKNKSMSDCYQDYSSIHNWKVNAGLLKEHAVVLPYIKTPYALPVPPSLTVWFVKLHDEFWRENKPLNERTHNGAKYVLEEHSHFVKKVFRNVSNFLPGPKMISNRSCSLQIQLHFV